MHEELQQEDSTDDAQTVIGLQRLGLWGMSSQLLNTVSNLPSRTHHALVLLTTIPDPRCPGSMDNLLQTRRRHPRPIPTIDG